MKKLDLKLLAKRKAANKRACKTFKADEGKPYSTHHYTEDSEMHWCDITFRRGKKVYNAMLLSLGCAVMDSVEEASYNHPDYKLLPQRDSQFGYMPMYQARLDLEKRIHEEGVLVGTGVKILGDYRYGTGLVVTFPTWTFDEEDVLGFIASWDGIDKEWSEFNSKNCLYSDEVQVNAVKM